MSETKPTKAEVWKTIYANLLAYDLVPVNVRLHPADITVEIQFQDDQVDDVASALALFDLPIGEVWAMDHTGPHLWSRGEAGECYAWGRYCNSYKQSKLLPGWNVSIYCLALTANYPLPEPDITGENEPVALAEFLDESGSTWLSRPDDMFALAGVPDVLGSGAWRTRAEVEADFGPLTAKGNVADPLAVASQQLRETTDGDEFAAAFGGFMTELGKAAEHEQGFHDDCDPARCADAEARVAELHGETPAVKA